MKTRNSHDCSLSVQIGRSGRTRSRRHLCSISQDGGQHQPRRQTIWHAVRKQTRNIIKKAPTNRRAWTFNAFNLLGSHRPITVVELNYECKRLNTRWQKRRVRRPGIGDLGDESQLDTFIIEGGEQCRGNTVWNWEVSVGHCCRVQTYIRIRVYYWLYVNLDCWIVFILFFVVL